MLAPLALQTLTGDIAITTRRPEVLSGRLTRPSDRNTDLMASNDMHGTVGIVRPTTRPADSRLIRMLPAECVIQCTSSGTPASAARGGNAMMSVAARLRRLLLAAARRRRGFLPGQAGHDRRRLHLRRHLRRDGAAVRAASRQVPAGQAHGDRPQHAGGRAASSRPTASTVRCRRTAPRWASSAAASCWSRCSAIRRRPTTHGA